MSVKSDEVFTFSEIVGLSKLKIEEVRKLSPILDEMYDNRHLLKSVGIDILYKGKAIT